MIRMLLVLWWLAAVGCGGQPHVKEISATLERVGATDWEPWEAWRLSRADRPPLAIYVAHTEEPKPLVVLLQGSGCTPLFAVLEGGTRRMSSLIFQREDLPDGVHVMVVEKVGVTSFDPAFDPAAETRCSDEYERNVGKDLRVREVVDAIRAVRAQPWVSDVLVAGHSEGADVAAGVGGVLGDELAAVGILSGAGGTQLFDFVLEGRVAGDDDAANQALVEAFGLAGETPPARYRGHSQERWQSYAIDSTPLDDLRAAEVPVFVAHGTLDTSSRIENADLFVVEMVRAKRRSPLFYYVLAGVDHGYRDAAGTAYDAEVIRRFVEWGLAADRRSGTELFKATGPAATADLKPRCEEVAGRALDILARDGDAKLKLAVAATPDAVRSAVIDDCLRDATDASVACMQAATDLAALKACK